MEEIAAENALTQTIAQNVFAMQNMLQMLQCHKHFVVVILLIHALIVHKEMVLVGVMGIAYG